MHHPTQSILAIFLSVSASAFSLPASAADAAVAAVNQGTEFRDRVSEGADKVGEYASDAFTTSKVKTVLLADDLIRGLEISVETMDKVVYLAGTVQTAAQKARAEELARGVDGVRSVVNHIRLPND